MSSLPIQANRTRHEWRLATRCRDPSGRARVTRLAPEFRQARHHILQERARHDQDGTVLDTVGGAEIESGESRWCRSSNQGAHRLRYRIRTPSPGGSADR